MYPQELGKFSWQQFYRQPESAFLILSLVFGIIFLLVVPPFQIPDEPAHFLRAYQVSQFDLVAQKKDGIVGGMLPESVSQVFYGWLDLPFHVERKAILELFQNSWQIPLQPSQKKLTWFSNSALYSPVPYFPQSIGIALGKFFHVPPLILMYLGRLFAGIAAIGITFRAIAIVPFLKWAFVFLSLTPMAIFLRSSLSADSMLIALSFLFVARCLDLAFRDRDRKRIDGKIAELLIVGSAIVLCKQVYFPLVFLFFLIPIRKLGNTKKYLLTASTVIVTSLLAAFLWSWVVKDIYVPSRFDVEIDPEQQFAFIVANPVKFLVMILTDLRNDIDFYLHQMVGVLGWLDTPLPNFLWISYLVLFSIVFLTDNPHKIPVYRWQKLGTLAVIFGGFFLVYVSIFMSWTGVDADNIIGIQGRYFYPFLPLFPFLLVNHRWQVPLPDKTWKLILVLYLIFVLSASLVILSDRYYGI
ncbi:DUF2142 domain-containing protein [Geitlerinema sp. PCC 9228]|jgi:uncharacterized membrane protein|uniref:DUF2142 domain-containing protein n=1 Tax=Geitlerinema sp. PCC 9228 TaxID=111611 RepID=UPI0008F9DBFB|nr:DUF2142 domain-containing protein [Geitlerinema sp. PCC 9228]